MIQWEPDTTGQWTNMVITLKTGDNYNMVPLMSSNSFSCAQCHPVRSQQFISGHHARRHQANPVYIPMP